LAESVVQLALTVNSASEAGWTDCRRRSEPVHKAFDPML
jgi:hypothetical protein